MTKKNKLAALIITLNAAAFSGCGEDSASPIPQLPPEQSECTLGMASTCSNNVVRYCDGQNWQTITCQYGCNGTGSGCAQAPTDLCASRTCPTGQMCNALTGVCEPLTQPECQNGSAPTCIGNAVQYCENGEIRHHSCESNQICLNGECSAKQTSECDEAEYPKCNGENSILTCSGGQLTSLSCPSGQICQDGTCQTKPNIPDEPECTSTTPTCDDQNNQVTCVDGHFSLASCGEKTCEDGVCVDKTGPVEEPECDESDYPKCNKNGLLETCENGKIKANACDSNQICENGVCKDKIVPIEEPECDEGDYPKCNEAGKLETCENGKIATKACAGDQTCEDGVCKDKPCEPETTKCQNGRLAECQSNKTWKLTTCGQGEICQDGQCIERGEAPKITTCPTTLTIGSSKNTCEKTGSGSRIVIRGDVLGLNETYLGGSIAIEGDKITYVGCDPDLKNSTIITCPDGVISPAFINGHEHVTFSNGWPAKWGDERFDHRHEWRKGKNGHTKVPGNTTSKGNANSVVEVRGLLAGTTSIFGSGSAPGLARNLDVKSSTIGGVTSVYQTFPLGDASDGTMHESGCSYTYHDTVTAFDDSCPYGPHIAEGINQAALNELRCLSGEGAGSKNIFKPNVAVIHGVGATVDMMKKMADKGMKLIWSPRTNISLYGDTAQVPIYDRLGVTIGLGTDWLYSGSANMLRELQCVDYLNQNYYSRYFSDYEIWKMPTWNNAIAFGVEKYLGQIAKGYTADIVVFKKTKTKDLYRAVIDAENKDVTLVTMNGNFVYGDSNLMTSGDEFNVCSVMKKIDFRIMKAKSEITSFNQLNTQKEDQYPMFFCGDPIDEPTCVPQRTRTKDTADQKTTKYTGDFTAADDADGDGIKDDVDNCPTMFNPIRPMDTNRKQADADGDGIGDICDLYPLCATNDAKCEGGIVVRDSDGDGLEDSVDNCPTVANADQSDTDKDGIGDACDACPNGESNCASVKHVVDFSCSSCKGTGQGYSGTYEEKVGNATFKATGNTTKYQEKAGITLTGDPSKSTKIEVTGLHGLGTLTLTYYSYNPTGAKGTLNITAGDFAAQLLHTYDSSHIVEVTTEPYMINDPSQDSFVLMPELSTKEKPVANDNRIHITKVEWTEF